MTRQCINIFDDQIAQVPNQFTRVILRGCRIAKVHVESNQAPRLCRFLGGAEKLTGDTVLLGDEGFELPTDVAADINIPRS